VEIGKPPATGAQELAKLYGQKNDPAGVGDAKTERGERQTRQSGSAGTGLAAAVEISSEARDRASRQEALQLAKEIYPSLPDSRQEVVISVREKLAAGWYESDAVQEALVDRLVGLLRAAEPAE